MAEKVRGNRRNRDRPPGEGIRQLAIPIEILKIEGVLLKAGLVGVPSRLLSGLFGDPALEPVWHEERLLDLVGDVLMEAFEGLGPLYGKAGQIVLSRLGERGRGVAARLRLNRLYGDWPALPFRDLEGILDRDIPGWKQEFRVDPIPLGVASMAQVHLATDQQGREWVIKVIKPAARRRLIETLRAMDQILGLATPMQITAGGRKLLKELDELKASLRRELDLDRELDSIRRVRAKLSGSRQGVLRIPETNDRWCTRDVLVVERFQGISLSEVVDEEKVLSATLRRKLARNILSELLIQVFELGLFHGDPHAGNLILLEDGSVGLFDWGLTGELLESDRRHIAAMLKAVVMLDLEQLIQALGDMSAEAGRELDPEDIRKELKRVIRLVEKRKAEGKKASFQELLKACLQGASALEIPVPDGLLMMAKSLLTIEGLARGIDPRVSLGRVASPILFKAARPGIGDLVRISRRLPHIAKKFFASSA